MLSLSCLEKESGDNDYDNDSNENDIDDNQIDDDLPGSSTDCDARSMISALIGVSHQ